MYNENVQDYKNIKIIQNIMLWPGSLRKCNYNEKINLILLQESFMKNKLQNKEGFNNVTMKL